MADGGRCGARAACHEVRTPTWSWRAAPRCAAGTCRTCAGITCGCRTERVHQRPRPATATQPACAPGVRGLRLRRAARTELRNLARSLRALLVPRRRDRLRHGGRRLHQLRLQRRVERHFHREPPAGDVDRGAQITGNDFTGVTGIAFYGGVPWQSNRFDIGGRPVLIRREAPGWEAVKAAAQNDRQVTITLSSLEGHGPMGYAQDWQLEDRAFCSPETWQILRALREPGGPGLAATGSGGRPDSPTHAARVRRVSSAQVMPPPARSSRRAVRRACGRSRGSGRACSPAPARGAPAARIACSEPCNGTR